ncbi:HpcH/HpaI aldolase/citrate lyase family protein [Pacificibacter maritimus]|nr:CoA ester lyase [Pacificibacter maritimus]
MTQLLRSALYIPASNTRALDKARGLACDAIVFDLEDAVGPDEKASARETLRQALAQGGYGRRLKIVRINGLDTPWGGLDVDALTGLSCDAVLLPKVNTVDDVDQLAQVVPNVPLWAMIETPLGVLNAREIARHERVAGFVMGTNDLAKDLGARFRADRLPLMTALQSCLLAARAHGVAILDGVFNAFKDEAGLRRECEQGRDLGFDGKTLIHPAQLAVANMIFAPSDQDIDLAMRQISAFEQAQVNGSAIAVVDGQIVENLHIVTAQALLDKAHAIKAME